MQIGNQISRKTQQRCQSTRKQNWSKKCETVVKLKMNMKRWRRSKNSLFAFSRKQIFRKRNILIMTILSTQSGREEEEENLRCLQDDVIHYYHSVPPRNKKKEKSTRRETKLFVALNDLKWVLWEELLVIKTSTSLWFSGFCGAFHLSNWFINVSKNRTLSRLNFIKCSAALSFWFTSLKNKKMWMTLSWVSRRFEHNTIYVELMPQKRFMPSLDVITAINKVQGWRRKALKNVPGILHKISIENKR